MTFGTSYFPIISLPILTPIDRSYTNNTPTTGETEHSIRNNFRNHQHSHQLPTQSLVLDLVMFLIAEDIADGVRLEKGRPVLPDIPGLGLTMHRLPAAS